MLLYFGLRVSDPSKAEQSKSGRRWSTFNLDLGVGYKVLKLLKIKLVFLVTSFICIDIHTYSQLVTIVTSSVLETNQSVLNFVLIAS